MALLRQVYCTSGTTCASMQLEKRKVIKRWLFGGGAFNMALLTYAILALFLYLLLQNLSQIVEGAFWFISSRLLFVFVVFALFVFVSLIYNLFYYRYYFYDLKEDRVTIRKGVVARGEVNIEYRKIQNVFVNQDFWDRIFRLYDVHIATADVQSAGMAHIDGVNATNAEILKNELLRRSKIAAQYPSPTGI